MERAVSEKTEDEHDPATIWTGWIKRGELPGTIIGWSLHQSDGTLDAKLEGLTILMRDIRGLLLKNHGARCERED